MKNNHKALAAAVCLTLLAAGCSPKREAVSSAPAPPEKEIPLASRPGGRRLPEGMGKL